MESLSEGPRFRTCGFRKFREFQVVQLLGYFLWLFGSSPSCWCLDMLGLGVGSYHSENFLLQRDLTKLPVHFAFQCRAYMILGNFTSEDL